MKQNQTLWWDLSWGFIDIETKWSKLSARLFPIAHTDLSDTAFLTTSTFKKIRLVNTEWLHPLGHVIGIYFLLLLPPQNKYIRMRSTKAKEILQEYNRIQIQKTYWKAATFSEVVRICCSLDVKYMISLRYQKAKNCRLSYKKNLEPLTSKFK